MSEHAKQTASNNQTEASKKNDRTPVTLPQLDDSILAAALVRPSYTTLTPTVMRTVNRMYGNQFAVNLVKNMTHSQSIQRGVWKENGTNAVAVPSQAKSHARYIVSKGLHSAGAIADGTKVGRTLFQSLDNFANAKGWTHNAADGTNTLVFEARKNHFYCGGRVFNNGPSRLDGSRLPTADTYTEWDMNELPVAGTVIGKRDGFRVVVGAGGRKFYSDDHYNNFTEFS